MRKFRIMNNRREKSAEVYISVNVYSKERCVYVVSVHITEY
jgi:hypothetical protein